MQRSNKEIDKQYHTTRWLKLKKFKKLISPFCEVCMQHGKVTPTYIVHHKEWINELNVFPVPDGDTGTNMTMTIMTAAKEVAAMG